MILQRFDTAQAAGAALAVQIAAALRQGLSQRGAASVAVPGGRTPLPLFHALRDADLHWDRVGITLTDERWVPEAHAASNAALVRRELLAGRAAAARLVPLYDGSASAAMAAPAVWQRLAALPRPFDAVLLGMGEDGHFASLFPGNEALASSLDADAAPTCVAMRAPTEPAERISLNLAALLQTQRLFLFATGAAKHELLLAGAHREARRQWPVAALLARQAPLPEVYWAP